MIEKKQKKKKMNQSVLTTTLYYTILVVAAETVGKEKSLKYGGCRRDGVLSRGAQSSPACFTR